MSFLDIFFSILIIYFIYKGYQQGFLSMLNSPVKNIFGVFLAYILSTKIVTLFYPNTISSYPFAFVVSFLVSIFALKVLFQYFYKFLTDILKKFSLEWIDFVLGGILGFMKVSLITFLILSVLGALHFDAVGQRAFKSSLVKILYSTSRKLTGINLMHEIRNFSFNKGLNKAQKALQKLEDMQPPSIPSRR